MHPEKLQINSLVLYKSRPARILALTDKVEIELEGGKSKRVREKDVILLHPGPVGQLNDFDKQQADVSEAWELLEGEATGFHDLLELVFGEPTPADAWSLWQVVEDGLWFEGDISALQPRSAERIEQDRNARAEKARREREWNDFLERLRERAMAEEDRKQLSEVERLALGQIERSRILESIDINSTAENAHRLLVELGYWSGHHNPHPGRKGLTVDSPQLPVSALPDDPRENFTGMEAWAIDDEYSNDPDDAVSFDGERIWVHVADVAALVAPGSELDLEARSRGANLYLPEAVSHMLPVPLTEALGLGLHAESPALSIGFRLSDGAVPEDIEISLSRIRVNRISYADANQCMDQEPFVSIRALTDRYRIRRKESGAAGLDLPEVSVRVIDGRPVIRPMERLDSREMVTDAMLMAGEAVAIYCQAKGIAVPFAVQAPPDEEREPQSLSEMYAYRRFFKPTRSSVTADLHAGLGLGQYTRATSPLRRYQDLLLHQQLRADLLGREPLDGKEVSIRASQADEGSAIRRRTERLSNQHWKLVWLQQNPDWRGRSMVVEEGERKTTLLIPELAYETKMRLRGSPGLDKEVMLKVREISLPEQSAYFQVV